MPWGTELVLLTVIPKKGIVPCPLACPSQELLQGGDVRVTTSFETESVGVEVHCIAIFL